MSRRPFRFRRPPPRRTLHALADVDRRELLARAAGRASDRAPLLVFGVLGGIAAVGAAVSPLAEAAGLPAGPFGVTPRQYATGAVMGLGLLAWHVLVRRISDRQVAAELRARGLCSWCGYDLRATPGKGGALLDRCPECGAVPAAGEHRKGHEA